MSRTNPYKKKRRHANKTLLIFGEGMNEEVFLKHLGTVAKHQIVLNFQILVNLSKKILANITTFPKIFLKKFPQNLKIYA